MQSLFGLPMDVPLYSQPTATIASIGDTEMNVPLTCLQTVLLLKSLK
jgi:hypothetical protein